MSHPDTPLASLSLGGIGLHTPAARAYLINVAETIQQVLLPALQGHAHKNASDCMETVLQLAAALQAPEQERDAIAAITKLGGDLRTQALAEGQVFESTLARADALIAEIRSAAAPLTRGVDAERVQAYLRAQPAGGDALRVISAVPLPGGRSKQTILVSIAGARDLPNELVFRQDWAAAVTGTSVAMEFEILRRVHAAGIRVPPPLLIENGSEALGAPFIVVGRLQGRAVGDLFDPPGAQAVRELAEQLGRIHALPVASFEGLPGIVERSYTTAQLREDLARFRASIEKLSSPLPALARYALDWLEQTAERVRSPRTLVHGDCGWHNNLVDGEHLTAVLDWEMAHVGSPALDLGWMKSANQKRVPWPEFMAIYQAAGGPAIDAFSIDWYSVYTKLWFMNLMLQARAAVAGGVLHDIDYTVVCAHYAPALMGHLSLAMKQALAHEH